MAQYGQYVMIPDYDRLTNQRCHAKDWNKTITYRNNWCENKGDCGSCSIARQYECWLEEA